MTGIVSLMPASNAKAMALWRRLRRGYCEILASSSRRAANLSKPSASACQLLTAPRLEPHLLGDAPEPFGDLAEMCHPILRKVLGHRHRFRPLLRYKQQ